MSATDCGSPALPLQAALAEATAAAEAARDATASVTAELAAANADAAQQREYLQQIEGACACVALRSVVPASVLMLSKLRGRLKVLVQFSVIGFGIDT